MDTQDMSVSSGNSFVQFVFVAGDSGSRYSGCWGGTRFVARWVGGLPRVVENKC
jgi:hypothetical protein